MKNSIKISLVMLLAFATSTSSQAQKKVKHFKVEKIINLSAAQVWAVVGQDYGSIAYSHPKIIKSEYVNGSLKGQEGAERTCYFNEKGSQFLKEKMTNFSDENMTFTNTISQAGKFPVDTDLTKAIYKVTDLGDGTCKISVNMTFRTKPAMMGGMMMGSFINLMSDYFISVEHHIKTGEKVTKENFKAIKKQYKDKATVTKF